jgi:hypothetical protein
MDLDEPEMSEPMIGESTDTFVGRIRLAKRVLPILRDLVARNFSLVVESDRRTSQAASLTSDFVLELGDARLRLILTPGAPDPIGDGRITAALLSHYMLDAPDADAVAIVADDDELSTWVFDIYALNTSAHTTEPAGLADALNAYFEDTVHPIELPNFRGIIALPSQKEIESTLERNASSALAQVKESRARIEERVTALGLLGPSDSQRLVNSLIAAIRTGNPSLTTLLETHD